MTRAGSRFPRLGDHGFDFDIALGRVGIWADEVASLGDFLGHCTIHAGHRHSQLHLQTETAIIARTNTDFGIDGGTEAMAELLDRHDPPTAIFAMSDEMAFEVRAGADRPSVAHALTADGERLDRVTLTATPDQFRAIQTGVHTLSRARQMTLSVAFDIEDGICTARAADIAYEACDLRAASRRTCQQLPLFE